MAKLLEINGLDVSFSTGQDTVYAVRDVSINLNPGEVLGIVGESGAGKSTIGNAIINLIEPPGKIINGEILFQDQNLRSLNDQEMLNIRGHKIGMIFQDPQTSLNPLMTIGAQLLETINTTKKLFGKEVPYISSTKSLTGHSLGAAGVHEAIYSLLMLKENFLAGSANIDNLDEKIKDAPILLENKELDVNRVLSNSFGFGGTNATLVMQKIT